LLPLRNEPPAATRFRRVVSLAWVVRIAVVLVVVFLLLTYAGGI
jgi:hypothetical protein